MIRTERLILKRFTGSDDEAAQMVKNWMNPIVIMI